MKKLLLLSLTSLFLFSCSADDSSPVTTENQNPDNPETPNSGILAQTISKVYQNGNITTINTVDYEDGRPVYGETLSSSNVLQAYTEFTYTSSGLLTKAVIYNPDGTEQNNLQWLHDSEERIYKVVQVGQYDLVYDFTFSGNTINGTGGALDLTFHMDEEGHVYKITNPFYLVQEYVLDDDHMPLSYTRTEPALTRTATYEYDTNHNPSLLNLADIRGSYVANRALDYLQVDDFNLEYATKYLTKKTEVNIANDITNVTEYIYTFNAQGLPTKKKTYINDELRNVTDYIYQ